MRELRPRDIPGFHTSKFFLPHNFHHLIGNPTTQKIDSVLLEIQRLKKYTGLKDLAYESNPIYFGDFSFPSFYFHSFQTTINTPQS